MSFRQEGFGQGLFSLGRGMGVCVDGGATIGGRAVAEEIQSPSETLARLA